MSSRFQGGILKAATTTPGGNFEDSSASGIWGLAEASYWTKQGLWPVAGNFNPNLHVENLFNVTRYTGTGSALTITNNINLSDKGGMVWIKRTTGGDGIIYDTARGATNSIVTNAAGEQATVSQGLTGFTTSGFTLGTDSSVNTSSGTYVAWTFRKQAKFFDVVTYTGNGAASRTINHNLGSTPGCIMIKNLNSSVNWQVYHRSLGTGSWLYLNTTGGASTSNSPGFANITSTSFDIGSYVAVNGSGNNFVALIFAHDAGGFGDSGNENIISCGSFTTTPSVVNEVDLGWEPEFVIIKRTTAGSGNPTIFDDWYIVDRGRGLNTDTSQTKQLYANSTGSENSTGETHIRLRENGFRASMSTDDNTTNIYIAIRRGLMKKPTDPTKVHYSELYTSVLNTSKTISGIGFRPDSFWIAGYGYLINDRSRGPSRNIKSIDTEYETSWNLVSSFTDDGATLPYDGIYGYANSGGSVYAYHMFKKARGFFDSIVYKGTGSARTIAHDLGVAPEIIFIKARVAGATTAPDFVVRVPALGNTSTLFLNKQDAAVDYMSYMWNSTEPTSSVFSLSVDNYMTNSSTGTEYIAWLFASCPGVSKIGTFTGTGNALDIDCGFTNGARFILIKRHNSTGNWYHINSSGIDSGNDRIFTVSSSYGQTTNTDWIDTLSSGFQLSNAAGNNLNINGAQYIYMAIA